MSATTRWVGCAAVGCEKLYTEQGEWHFSKLLVCKYAPISNHGIRRPYYQGMISYWSIFQPILLGFNIERPVLFILYDYHWSAKNFWRRTDLYGLVQTFMGRFEHFKMLIFKYAQIMGTNRNKSGQIQNKNIKNCQLSKVLRLLVQIGTNFQKIPNSVQNTDNRNQWIPWPQHGSLLPCIIDNICGSWPQRGSLPEIHTHFLTLRGHIHCVSTFKKKWKKIK